MDVQLLLELPINIRQLIYNQLDGRFTQVEPRPIEELYSSDSVQVVAARYKKSKSQKLIHKNLYHLFEPYINIFEYSPALICKWLDYSLWLRYDCIVLDCLRLNHSYGGSLIGELDWLRLDKKPRLALFKDSMLQVWYTYREYIRWVANKNPDFRLNYLRINLEYLKYTALDGILKSLRQDGMFDLVNTILFEQDNEDATVEVHSSEEEVPNQLVDHNVIKVIKHMESMKNLKEIIVRGDSLYGSLVNLHGVRDNPGKTINYIVRNRVMKIGLRQLSDTGVCDLNRWENLRELSISNVQKMDLNKMKLPGKCQILVIRNVFNLIWWNLLDLIESADQSKFKIKKTINNGYTGVRIIDYDAMDDPNTIGEFKSLVWKTLGPLNSIKLQNVHQIQDARVIVPNYLYDNKRLLLLGTTLRSVKEITVA